MSTERWAGFCFAFFGACFIYGVGCGSSSTGGPAADAGISTTTSTVVGSGGSTTTSSTTTTGTGGSGGSGGAPPGSTNLGKACTADAQCGAGFICIKSSDNVDPANPGGFGNGLCTADCTQDPTICPPLGGLCTVVADTPDGGVSRAVCFETCTIGPAPPAPPVAKCHSRQDVACEPVNADNTLFACIPLCVTDVDCGTGRKCESRSGLCVDTPKTGKPVGAGCTVTTGQSNGECEGFCLAIEGIPDGGTSTPGICTSLCRLGTLEACGFRTSGLYAGPPEGACILPVGDQDYNNGDLGFCLQLCDSQSDCGYTAANWMCRTDITLRGWGHSVCFVPKPG